MATQFEETVRLRGSGSRAVALTPQARRSLEGPVLATLLWLTAPTGAGGFARVRKLTRAGAALAAGGCSLVGGTAALFPGEWMGLFTSEPAVAGFGGAYLTRVGPAYAFLGLGLALNFAAQGRGRTAQPLVATLTRLLVAGALGALGLIVFGWGD